MLIRTYMEELREHTNCVLYENWRSEKLYSHGLTQDPKVFQEVKCVPFSFFLSILFYFSDGKYNDLTIHIKNV